MFMRVVTVARFEKWRPLLGPPAFAFLPLSVRLVTTIQYSESARQIGATNAELVPDCPLTIGEIAVFEF